MYDCGNCDLCNFRIHLMELSLPSFDVKYLALIAMRTMTDGQQNRQYKQVLVVRSDIKMGKGKIAVQCSHAAVSASEEARKSAVDWWRIWMQEGQLKVAVKVNGFSSILDLERKSRENRLP